MEQIDVLKHVVDVLERLQINYALVGSWGSGVHGEPRFTRDIDIVVDLPESSIANFCTSFPTDQYYLSADAVAQAVRNRFQFNLLHPASGNKVDFMMPGPSHWSAGQLARRRRITVGSGESAFAAYVAAPEDIIIGKLWYYSEGGGDRHLRDIAGILRVTGEGINRTEVTRWAKELGYLELWQTIIAKVDAPDATPGPGVP